MQVWRGDWAQSLRCKRSVRILPEYWESVKVWAKLFLRISLIREVMNVLQLEVLMHIAVFWELSWEHLLWPVLQLQVGEQLGHGSIGQLYKGKYLSQDVAIKVIEIDASSGNSTGSDTYRIAPATERLQIYKQEVSIMRWEALQFHKLEVSRQLSNLPLCLQLYPLIIHAETLFEQNERVDLHVLRGEVGSFAILIVHSYFRYLASECLQLDPIK